MSNIAEFLQKILSARYGKDVRQSIHDAIEEVDKVADTAQNSATKAAEAAMKSEQASSLNAQESEAFRNEAEQFRNEAALFTPDGYDVFVQITTETKERVDDLEENMETIFSGVETLGESLEKVSSEVETNKNNIEKVSFKVDTVIEKADLRIKETASGESIYLTDSADAKVVEFSLYGKATQDGEPTPDTSVEIEVAGKSYNLLENTAVSQELNGVSFTVSEDGSIIANGTASSVIFLNINSEFLFKKGNYILSGCPSGGSQSTYYIATQPSSSWVIDDGNGVSFEVLDEKAFRVELTIKSGTKVENLIFKPMIREASVKEDSYIPYGGIVTVKSYRKNLIDQQDMSINGAGWWIYGNVAVDVSAGAKKLYLPKGTYTLSFQSDVTKDNAISTNFYNKKSEIILNVSGGVVTGYNEFIFTLEEDIYSIRSYTNTTINISKIQIEKGEKRTEYEQYKGTSFAIPTPNGLAGIKVDSGGNYTDENGQQWVCDEIVKYADGSGEYIQRLKEVVFDGSDDEVWGKSASTANNSYYAVVSNVLDHHTGLLCNRFMEIGHSEVIYYDSIGCAYGVAGRNELRIGFGLESNITTVPLLREWLSKNNVKMIYRLAEPIRTPLTAEQIAEIEKLCTFYPVTNIYNDADCGMKVTYQADSKNYIDKQLDLQKQAQEAAMINMLLLLPEETQAAMIENDTNNLLLESEV